MNGEQRKLVVFVPEEALDAVRDALFEAGAGRIGDYERCSWYTAGTGTFLGGEGTAPAIGVATNNVAEYRALVAGLAKAVELGLDELEVVSDSELVVKQMRGEYKVKNAALADLKAEAEDLARRLPKVVYTAVRREHNELADRLVNEALDQASL